MNCLITIKDYHCTDGEVEKAEMITTAEVDGNPELFTVTYNEQSDELVGCVTKLTVTNGKRIVISRSGKYNTELVIEHGKRHNCSYNTPMGQLMMGVYATNVKSEFKENEYVKLDFSYTLDFNNMSISKNRLKITAEFKEV